VTEFLLYSALNRQVKIEVLLNNETLCLTQKRRDGLFFVGVLVIFKYLKNIFDSVELKADAVVSIMEITAVGGKNTKINITI